MITKILNWLKTNWKQILVVIFSIADAWLLKYHHEWVDYEVIALTLLGGYGIHLAPLDSPLRRAGVAIVEKLLKTPPPTAMLTLLVAVLLSCTHDSPPLVAPDPNGANCIAERVKRQLECVQTHSTREEIDACKEDVRLHGPQCTTEAGIADYVTSTTKDAGAE